MSRLHLNLIVFFVGLAALGWIAGGYLVGGNLLALAVTLVIGAAYVAGALELRRYRQATSTVAQAVTGLSEAPPNLATWLDQLHPSLRNAVRLPRAGVRHCTRVCAMPYACAWKASALRCLRPR